MDITFKDIPDEIINQIKGHIKAEVENYHRNKVKPSKEALDKAETDINAFKEANKE